MAAAVTTATARTANETVFTAELPRNNGYSILISDKARRCSSIESAFKRCARVLFGSTRSAALAFAMAQSYCLAVKHFSPSCKVAATSEAASLLEKPVLVFAGNGVVRDGSRGALTGAGDKSSGGGVATGGAVAVAIGGSKMGAGATGGAATDGTAIAGSGWVVVTGAVTVKGDDGRLPATRIAPAAIAPASTTVRPARRPMRNGSLRSPAAAAPGMDRSERSSPSCARNSATLCGRSSGFTASARSRARKNSAV